MHFCCQNCTDRVNCKLVSSSGISVDNWATGGICPQRPYPANQCDTWPEHAWHEGNRQDVEVSHNIKTRSGNCFSKVINILWMSIIRAITYQTACKRIKLTLWAYWWKNRRVILIILKIPFDLFLIMLKIVVSVFVQVMFLFLYLFK